MLRIRQYLAQPLRDLTSLQSKPKIVALLGKLGLKTVKDILMRLPKSSSLIYAAENLQDLRYGVMNQITLTPTSYSSLSPYAKVLTIRAVDGKGIPMDLTFFNTYKGLRASYPLGTEVTVEFLPKVRTFPLKAIHPKKVPSYRRLPIKTQQTCTSYELTSGLTSQMYLSVLQEIIRNINALIPVAQPSEWLPNNLAASKYGGTELILPRLLEGLLNLHQGAAGLTPEDPNYLRLALDEILTYLLYIREAKQKQKALPGITLQDGAQLYSELVHALPFELTYGQQEVIKTIIYDVKSSRKMVRLLQGDVGSGKTIIAVFMALLAAQNGYQACIVCPTENLAQQTFSQVIALYEKLRPLTLRSGDHPEANHHPHHDKIQLFLGSTPLKQKNTLLTQLKDSSLSILVTTHAGFEDKIEFARLAAVIIDEQHKFGVEQRQKIISKNPKAHVLLLSATPIPRTLEISKFGNISLSRLTEKPQNRYPIKTSMLSEEKLPRLAERIALQIQTNQQKVFWVCPAIGEEASNPLPLKLEGTNSMAPALTQSVQRHKELGQFIPKGKLWLLHGRMKSAEKQKILQKFRDAPSGVLVSTVVIEVGIDVPDSNIIVIENAERFGLAQLHQLRGRVGRGGNQRENYCILLHPQKLGAVAQSRLQTLCESNDGFYIAEKDYELRGSGNVLGAQQSGETKFTYATEELFSLYAPQLSVLANNIINSTSGKHREIKELLTTLFTFNLKLFESNEVFISG